MKKIIILNSILLLCIVFSEPIFGRLYDITDKLASISDVYISGVADNDVLQYNSTTKEWENVVSTSIGGLGTMAIQDSNTVNIDGGAIDGTTVGATTPSTGKFTTITGVNQTLTGRVTASSGDIDSLWNAAGGQVVIDDSLKVGYITSKTILGSNESLWFDRLVLGYGGVLSLITTSDTNENFTIDPNGNGMTRILGGTAIGDTLTATTDRYLYFGTDGSYTNEFLKWDEATTNFILSDSLYASGYVGLGTMATQNANAVAITGGTASLDTLQIDSGKTIILPKPGELTNGQFAVIKGIRLTAGYGTTAIGDLVYLNNDDSKFEKTDADTAATAADVLVGVVCEAVAENADCLIMLEGTMTVDSWNWGTPGASLWISETAGEFEETLGNISDINDIVRPVAYVLDDDTIYFHGGTAYATKE